ncbi:MAG: hypothetical protein ABIM50_12800 [Novosphingobium sp.]
MKRLALLLGASLAMTSAWALAQNGPESLLPPGFDRPAPKAAPSRTPAPAPASAPAAGPARSAGPGATTTEPAVQRLPTDLDGPSGAVSSAPVTAAAPSVKLPPLDVVAKMSSDELTDMLGLRPKFDIPAAARRSMAQIGVLAENEGGLPAASLTNQNASLVRAALIGNKGRMVSRWGHILLRRALASRLDAPAAMNPADFAAMRAALLLRMGEGNAARDLVQDIDSGNYSPDLTQAALDAYIFTADFTGMCPAVTIQGGARKDAQWQAVSAICAAFRGDGNTGLAQLDRQLGAGAMPKIDLLLAQKYAGAAGKARRAVKIEWDGVNELTPWRYALTIGVGLQPPPGLMKNANPQISYMAATAPMLGLEARATAADVVGGEGVLSSAAMVDLWSQIYALEDITGEWSDRADQLRSAYVGGDANAKMKAIRGLWDGAGDAAQRYSRQVLTAYAAARIPADSGLRGDAGELIASMLAAGLDENAMRWVPLADTGTQEWGLLALAAPTRSAAVELAALEKFNSGDNSDESRKSGFLLAGLAGLGRISPETAADFAKKLNLDMTRKTRWTAMIDQSAQVRNGELVALLAGLGMQGSSWSKMTPLYLYHIVAALQQVGLDAEARMIAAEAVARA